MEPRPSKPSLRCPLLSAPRLNIDYRLPENKRTARQSATSTSCLRKLQRPNVWGSLGKPSDANRMEPMQALSPPKTKRITYHVYTRGPSEQTNGGAWETRPWRILCITCLGPLLCIFFWVTIFPIFLIFSLVFSVPQKTFSYVL